MMSIFVMGRFFDFVVRKQVRRSRRERRGIEKDIFDAIG